METLMQVQVARWGNSLGLRIPKDIARRAGLREGARVEIEANGIDTLARPITYAGAAASAAILDDVRSYRVGGKGAAPVVGGRQATVWRRDRVCRSRGLPG